MPGATRHSGSGRAARYSATGTRAPLPLDTSPPVNSIDPMATTQAAVPAPPTGRAVPVSRSAENGGSAGSDTRTAPGLAASQRASGDPAAGSRSGLPSCVDRTGTGPALPAPPRGPVSPLAAALIAAVAARATVVRASSGSEG